jgi:hypothetical protein
MRRRAMRPAHFRTEESSRPPSTWVIAGEPSGSEARQLKRDLPPLEGSLTTTRDLRPSSMIVDRAESALEVIVVPSPGTSQTGPVATALGMTVPGGQPAAEFP